VAELHLGRTEEAEAALEQALKKEPQFADAIANALVLGVITGKTSKAEESKRYYLPPQPGSTLLTPFQCPGDIGPSTSLPERPGREE